MLGWYGRHYGMIRIIGLKNCGVNFKNNIRGRFIERQPR